MKILALEFSSARRSVAVLDDSSGAPPNSAVVSDAQSRGVTAMMLVDQVLKKAGLLPGGIDVLAVGLGPGSYTGIRSAIATAQGWQLALGIKLLGISSMECLAANALAQGQTGKVTLIVDAQRKELYAATYLLDHSGYRGVEPLRIIAPAEVPEGSKVLGPGASTLIPGALDLFPTAEGLAEMARNRTDYVRGEQLQPIYLREITFVKAPPPRLI